VIVAQLHGHNWSDYRFLFLIGFEPQARMDTRSNRMNTQPGELINFVIQNKSVCYLIKKFLRNFYLLFLRHIAHHFLLFAVISKKSLKAEFFVVAFLYLSNHLIGILLFDKVSIHPMNAKNIS
jgi:hypothetical protein